jgi:hypothetical protein
VTCSCTAVVPEAGVTGLFIPHYWMPRLLDLDEVSLVACALWLTGWNCWTPGLLSTHYWMKWHWLLGALVTEFDFEYL